MNYSYSIINFIFKLHFGSFGGYTLRIIYFVLSMITCFMIISGILIWRTARDNKKYTFTQRVFHHKVTKWYLAICLSMFPAFAVLFLANKFVPLDMAGRVTLVNQIFFLSWLGLTVLGLFWKNYSAQNRYYLILGGALALLIPMANGVMTGGWIWKMWNSYHWVAYVDLFWLSAGAISLYLSFFVLKVKPTSDYPEPLVGGDEAEKVTAEVPPAKPLMKPKLEPQLVGFTKVDK